MNDPKETKQLEAQKIAQLLKSSNEKNRLLGYQLLDTLQVHQFVKAHIVQQMGYACFKHFDQLEASYTFRGEASHDELKNALAFADRLGIDQYHRRRIITVLSELAIWSYHWHLELAMDALMDVRSAHCVVLFKTCVSTNRLTTPLHSLEYFNAMAHDTALMKQTYKKVIKANIRSQVQSLYYITFLDIIRKTRSPLQYALYPTNEDDKVLFIIKATVSFKDAPPVRKKSK